MSDLSSEVNKQAASGQGLELRRSFNLTGSVVMSAGLVIGVGLFTVSTNAVGFLGPTLLLANLFALVVSVLTSLVYAELAAMWPFSGGSYAYAYEAWGKLGPFAGFLVAWTILGGYTAVGAEALAFANYFLSTLDYLGWWKVMVNGEAPYAAAAAVGSLLILAFTVVNWFGTKNVSVSQKLLMFLMWGFMAVSIISVSFSSLDTSNYHPFVPEWFDGGTFIMACTLIWWAYAGQEVIGTMGEEIRFPTVTIPRALILVPFVVFAVTTTMQWIVVGILPDVQILREAGAPFALALQTAGVSVVVFMLFMIAEFMGNFSTVNPLLTGSSRVLFALGRNGYLPLALGKLSRRRTPAWAVWIAGIAAIALLVTNSLLLIAQYTAFFFLFLYGFASVTLIVARITRPDATRPFKVPLYPITPLLVLGFVIYMMSGLPSEVIIGGLGWLAIAVVFFLVWTRLPAGRKERAESGFFKTKSADIPLPTREEKAELDKEFRSFALKIGLALLICVAFYAITFFW